MFILKFRRAKYIPITIKQRLFKFQRIYIEILWDLRTNQRFKRKFKKWHVIQTVQLGEKESHINNKLPLRSKEGYPYLMKISTKQKPTESMLL